MVRIGRLGIGCKMILRLAQGLQSISIDSTSAETEVRNFTIVARRHTYITLRIPGCIPSSKYFSLSSADATTHSTIVSRELTKYSFPFPFRIFRNRSTAFVELQTPHHSSKRTLSNCVFLNEKIKLFVSNNLVSKVFSLLFELSKYCR